MPLIGLMSTDELRVEYDTDNHNIHITRQRGRNYSQDFINEGSATVKFDDLVEIVCRADFEHDKILANKPKG